MRRTGIVIALIGAAGLSAISAARGDDAQKVFDGLYADQLKLVRASIDGKDDLELAERMLSAAADSDSPRLIMLLCYSAYDLADRRNAPAQAAAAMRLVLDKASGEALDARSKLSAALRKAYFGAKPEVRAAAGEQLIEALLAEADVHAARGSMADAVAAMRMAAPVAAAIKSKSADTVKARLESLQSRQQADAQVNKLRERLAAKPDDPAGHRELARLLLAEMDSPEQALPHAGKADQEPYRKFVPLAAKPLTELPLPQCPELGDWLRALAGEAGLSNQGKANLLRRARACYERYVSTSTEPGLTMDKAKLVLTEIKATLAKLEPAGTTGATGTGATAATGTTTSETKVGDKPAGAGFDGKLKVLDEAAAITPEDGAVDITRILEIKGPLVKDGIWESKDGKITIKPVEVSQVPQSTMRLTTTGDYELEVKFERLAAVRSSSLNLYIPVGKTGVWAFIGAAWDWNGLSPVDRRQYYDQANPTASNKHGWDTKRIYTVRTSVKTEGDQARVLVTVDGKTLMDWKGAQSSLDARTGTFPFVVGTFGSITIHRIAVRAQSGRFQIINYAK